MNKKIIKTLTNKLAMSMVVVPFTLFSAYTLFVASPRYVSNSSIVVQNISGGTDFSGVGALLMAGIQGTSAGDLMLIKEYINSPDMLEELNQKFNILNHWSSPSYDILYKLWDKEYRELSIDYFKGKIKPIFNMETGTLQISVETFDAKVSKEVLDFILKRSEDFVNNNNHNASKEQLSFIEGKVIEVKKELDESRKKIIDFQKSKQFFTPESEMGQTSRKIMLLEESKIKAEAEFNAKKTYLQENSTKMITLTETIKFLDKQIEEEKSKLIGNGKKERAESISEGLNDYADEYKILEGELNLNIEKYRNALITYEKVKIDTSRKIKQVIMISTPQEADYPIYPNKKIDILYAFIVLNLIFGLVSLLKDVVKDHK